MQAKLIVVGGTTKNKEILLRLPTVIGRGRSCNVQLPYALVSRKHCEIFEEEGRLWARDLGSLNGTFLDGKRIATAEVVSGCHLTIGSVTFRVEHDLAPAGALPAGPAAKLAMPPAAGPIPVAQPIRPVTPPSAVPLAQPLTPAAPLDATPPDEEGREPEDDVEVVDDVSDLLPPNVAKSAGKTAINSATQGANDNQPPPHDEDDLAAFLRSLGDK